MADTSEVGSSQYTASNIDITGIERLPALRGDRWYRTVREMVEQDATVGSLVFAIEMTLRNLTWSAVRPDDSDESKKWQLFLEQSMDDMTMGFVDLMSIIVTFVTYGYSPFELVYKVRQGPTGATPSRYDDNLVGWKKWAPRSPASKVKWLVENGDVVAWVQRLPLGGEQPIPIDKMLIYRAGARSDSFEGTSILKRAYRSYANKLECEVAEMIGMRRDLAGLLVASIPDEVLQSTRPDDVKAVKAWQNIVRNTHRGNQEGILKSSDPWRNSDGTMSTMPRVKVELLASPGTRQFNTSQIIDRHRTDIAMTGLADWMMVGHQKVGARSVSESKTQMFETALGGWADMIEENTNDQAVARLYQINGVPEQYWSRWEHKDVADADLTVLSTLLQTAMNTGALPKTPQLAVWIAEQLGAPIPTEDQLKAMEERANAPAPAVPPVDPNPNPDVPPKELPTNV